MQAVLARTGLLQGMDFGAQVIRAQEIVGDPQPAGGVAF
jgi:hypothetical protein